MLTGSSTHYYRYDPTRYFQRIFASCTRQRYDQQIQSTPQKRCMNLIKT